MTGRHGFLLSKGAFTTIDPPGAVFSNPLGINSGGEIVGWFCTTLPCASDRENVHGFLRVSSLQLTSPAPEEPMRGRSTRAATSWPVTAIPRLVRTLVRTP